jgi:hypothetical protein
MTTTHSFTTLFPIDPGTTTRNWRDLNEPMRG